MIVILVGGGASGKSTVVDIICKRNPIYKKIVTYTTRPMRPGEKDGVDYFFISDEKYNAMTNANEFAEHNSYRGWHYGTVLKDIPGFHQIYAGTPAGARQVRKSEHIDVDSIRVIYLRSDRRNRLIRMLERGDDIDEACRRSLSDVGQLDRFEDESDLTIDDDLPLDDICDKIVNYISDQSYIEYYKDVVIKNKVEK